MRLDLLISNPPRAIYCITYAVKIEPATKCPLTNVKVTLVTGAVFCHSPKTVEV